MNEPKIKSESTGVYKVENLKLNTTYKLEHLKGKNPNIEKLTIFNVYVEMESQEQCDRMKKLCLDNGLPIWGDFRFNPVSNDNSYVYFYNYDGDFCNWMEVDNNHYSPVTEQQFINLLKEYKDGI